MSGMELLLQAAGCSDGVGLIGRGINLKRDVIACHPPSNSMSSLPPKKRMRLGLEHYSGVTTSPNESTFHLRRSSSFTSSLSDISAHGSGCTDAPTLDSEWTATENLPRPPLFNTIVVPTRSVNDRKTNTGGSKKSQKSAKANKATKKRPAPSHVKDVDGNDVGMGYFSMPSRRSSPAVEDAGAVNPHDANKEEHSPEAASPKSIIRVAAAPKASAPVTKPSPVDKAKDDAAAAKAMLYQAYLQALNQNRQ